MPNWCYNTITINGSPDKISRIKTIVELKQNDNGGFFRPLIGATIGDDWYDYNINNYGTKWDIDVTKDMYHHCDENTLSFGCESAWSPPIIGMVNVCKKYGVSCEMLYEECGNDFYGKTTISDDGTYVEEDYGYREGMYRLDNDYFWESLDNDMDYLMETLEDEIEGGATIKEVVDNEYTYVSESDKVELIDILEKEYTERNEKMDRSPLIN